MDLEECRDFRSDFNRVSNINNEISFYFCYKHQSSTTLNCLKYFICFYLNNRSILNYYYVVLQFYHGICNKIIYTQTSHMFICIYLNNFRTMLIRASLRLKQYQRCASALRQSLSTGGSHRSRELKKVAESQKSNSQLSTSFSEKAKDNVKTGGYGLVLLGGLGLIAVVAGTIFKVK